MLPFSNPTAPTFRNSTLFSQVDTPLIRGFFLIEMPLSSPKWALKDEQGPLPTNKLKGGRKEELFAHEF